MARDLSYRRNQWPAGVTLVALDDHYAALRIRPSGVGPRRRPGGGEWEPVLATGARRARRPWLVRIGRADGPDLVVRPFRPGEAGMPDVGRPVGRSGADDGTETPDAPDLGDNPISLVVSLLYVLASIVVFPIGIAGLARRSRAARTLRDQLRGAVQPAPEAQKP